MVRKRMVSLHHLKMVSLHHFKMVFLHHLKMVFPHHLKMLITGNKPISELRVPCPYDPKHTCFASKMDKHLRICNSKVIKFL